MVQNSFKIFNFCIKRIFANSFPPYYVSLRDFSHHHTKWNRVTFQTMISLKLNLPSAKWRKVVFPERIFPPKASNTKFHTIIKPEKGMFLEKFHLLSFYIASAVWKKQYFPDLCKMFFSNNLSFNHYFFKWLFTFSNPLLC